MAYNIHTEFMNQYGEHLPEAFNANGTIDSTKVDFSTTKQLSGGKVSPVLASGAPGSGVAVTPMSSDGSWQSTDQTNAAAFTINAPSPAIGGSGSCTITLEIYNHTGGALGVITWDGAYEFNGLVWTNPADTKKRRVTFQWSGLKWVALSISGADY